MSPGKGNKNSDNEKQDDFSINDLGKLNLIQQWEKLVTLTYYTVKAERKYKDMKLEDFKSNIYTLENSKMKQGRLQTGFDWDTDFLTPMFQEFIEMVKYYFILFYYLLFNFILTVTLFISY